MAKTLKGLSGGTVIEIGESYEGSAYRAIYMWVMRMRSTQSREGDYQGCAP